MIALQAADETGRFGQLVLVLAPGLVSIEDTCVLGLKSN
jgi:hypothetical protein